MNFYDDFVIKCSPTGSNYICNPPVTDTDIDTVFLVRPEVGGVGYTSWLAATSWEPCIGEGYEVLGGDFTAWRKGNKNYICTTMPDFYRKYVLATRICKMMNLLNKQDRIWMFKVVMKGAHMPSSGQISIPKAPDGFGWTLQYQNDATIKKTIFTNTTEPISFE